MATAALPASRGLSRARTFAILRDALRQSHLKAGIAASTFIPYNSPSWRLQVNGCDSIAHQRRSFVAAASAHVASVESGQSTAVTGDGAAKSAGATDSASAPSWKAAIDFKWVRDNREAMEANVKERKANADVGRVVELYEDFVAKTMVRDEMT